MIESAGVGYEVFVPLATYYRMPSVGAQVELEIRQVVREDAIALYGFASLAEKRAFDLLLKVQHVGPTLALKVLSVLSPRDIGLGDWQRGRRTHRCGAGSGAEGRRANRARIA